MKDCRIIFIVCFGLFAVFSHAQESKNTIDLDDYYMEYFGHNAPEDYFKRGHEALVRGDYDDAINYLTKAHKKGSIDASYWIGECLFNGWGVAKNQKQSLEYFQYAANQGQADACFVLGSWYYNGIELGNLSIKTDTLKGMEWLEIASNKNNSNAQWYLGDCYFISGDYETGFKWYKKSADLNNPTGMERVGVRLMDGDGVAQDINSAILYFNKAKAMGLEGIDLLLGKAYYKLSDYARAINYFSSIGEKDEEALRWLGSCYSAQKPADYVKALKYWEMAASKKEMFSLLYSGLCYYEGLGCEKNFDKATGYLEQLFPSESISVEKEYYLVYGIGAKFLGNCYRYGRGVKANQEIANYYYSIAKDLGYEDVTIREVIENMKRFQK